MKSVNSHRYGFLIGAILVGIVFILISTSAVAQSGSSADRSRAVHWPPPDQASPADRTDLGLALLDVQDGNGTEVHVLDSRLEALNIERLNDTSSRVYTRSVDGDNHTFLQRHGAPPSPEYPSDENRELPIPVPPTALYPTVQVARGASPSQHPGLWVWGPPGAFNVTGGTSHQVAEDVFETLGLPNPTPTRDRGSNGTQAVASGSSEDPRFPLYTREACITGASEACNRTASLELACENCTRHTYSLHPSTGEDLTRELNGSIKVVARNAAKILLGPDGRIVGVEVPPWYDLDPSDVLDPSAARDRATDAVEDRGYQVNKSHRPGVVRLSWAQNVTSGETTPQYRWIFKIHQESPEGGDVSEVRVEQNAQAGAVTEVSFAPGVGSDVPPSGGSSAPAPGVLGLVTTTLLALVAVRRRGRGDR